MIIKCLILFYMLTSLNAYYPSNPVAACKLPRIENGRVRPRQRGRLIKYICYPRYELVGNRYSTCMNGRWDEPSPICVKSGCPVPEIENGISSLSHNDAWAVFFCLPGHNLVGSQVIYCDGEKWNATAPTCVDTTTTVQNLNCDFEETDLCGWIQDDLHDFDWRRRNKKTPSSFLSTGPSYDHTHGKDGSGYYMYIESTSRLENDTARLISPIRDSSLAKSGCFSFWYHMYGASTGGLRVYQKPENLPLAFMLMLPPNEKKKYILFEEWGNQGDDWYNAVPQLNDFSDNFQIVIEGIRGRSFTSDIAIDDVAILQGSNCTEARAVAPTPVVFLPESCSGRCQLYETPPFDRGCGCNPNCYNEGTCCPDFFELCVFATSEDGPANSTEVLPETQKLVGVTETTTTVTTTTSRPSSPATPPLPPPPPPLSPPLPPPLPPRMTPPSIPYPSPLPPQRTTPPPSPTTTQETSTKQAPKIFNPKPKTTPKPVTTTTTVRTTTVAIPTTLPTTTTKATTTTQATTTSTTTTTTKKPATTTRRTVPTQVVTKKRDATTIKPKVRVSNIDAEKRRKEEYIETRYEKVAGKAKGSGSSSVVTGVVVLVAISCVAIAAWAFFAARSARGREALARFRGRTQGDSEVRYLNSDVDD